MRILYIGKFQPFHLGHLRAISLIRELSNDIVLAIGSPRNNQYISLDERIRMVMKNTSICPKIVDDLERDHPMYNNWGRYVLKVTGDVDIVATGNPIVNEDFSHEGKHILFFNRDEKKLSGTIVRKLIESKDQSWVSLVPDNSVEIIKTSEYYARYNYERR